MEPINYAEIFRYGFEMTVTLLIAFCLYLLKVKRSSIEIKEWLKGNTPSILISFAISWLLAIALGTSPGINEILGALGFAANQSAAAMAMVIASLTLNATSKPAGVE